MPKAEVGSTKHVANKMKSKGLQRLRWYCQVCEKQCRDENGFKQHSMSESHVRGMLEVGQDANRYINEYSNQFKRDFLSLLKTSHGEKKVHMNNFYQEYIRDKEHIHMNSTKWHNLTEFAKYLGKEGICRIEEGERGPEISFIDDTPEAVARREDVKRKEKQAKGEEDMESRLLNQQMKRAKEAAKEKERLAAEQRKINGVPESKSVVAEASAEPVKLSFSLGAKSAQKPAEPTNEPQPEAPVAIETFSAQDIAAGEKMPSEAPAAPAGPVKISLGGLGGAKKPNPLMGKKTNPLSGKKANPLSGKRSAPAPAPQPEKKMSNAERIMREEQARNAGGGKRQRLG